MNNTLLFIRHCNYAKFWTLKIPSELKIIEIKNEIEKKWKIEVNKQNLFTNSVCMDDNKKICEYNIDNKDVIYVHLKYK